MYPERDLQLIIFDCDGVLVDSETISNAVLARALTAEGLPTTLAQSRRDYQGLLLTEIDSRAQAKLGRPLAQDWIEWSVPCFVDSVHERGDSPKREQLAYQDAVQLLQANSEKPLQLPAHWFVIDSPQPDAAVCGDALMVSRGLLETDYVAAVLAHELGHLASPDARLTTALNRLIMFSTPFRAGAAAGRARPQMLVPRLQYTPREATDVFDLEPDLTQALFGFLRFLFIVSLFAKGGLGLWLTGPVWGRYWREREYHADQYAASLGQAEELADFLEVHALIHDNPIPFLWLTEHTHPPTELRIDRLRPTPDETSADTAVAA
jgi:Zn-dependent protease with chaperone function